MNGLALCAGIGGLELGLQYAIGPAYRTIAAVESDPSCIKVLVGNEIPVWDDLTTFDGREFSRIGIISAGFPCQPFSTASRGRKISVDLWPQVFRVIYESAPHLVFLENVQSHPISEAAASLCALGYETVTAPIDSSQVGAPDRRVRHWLLAHAHDARESAIALHDEVAGLPEIGSVVWWEKAPHSLLAMDDGLPEWLDRGTALRLLGNAVNPLQGAVAFRWLLERLVE